MASFEMELIPEDNGVWMLKMVDEIDRENFQLASTIESSAIVTKLTEVQAHTLVIDLSNAKQLGSLGLQLLFVLHKLLAAHNVQIVLRQPNAHLRQVLRIMAFDQVFRIEAKDNSCE